MAATLAAFLLVWGGIETLSAEGLKPYLPTPGDEQARAFGQSLFRKIEVHHEPGINIGMLAASKEQLEEVIMLHRLVVAENRAMHKQSPG